MLISAALYLFPSDLAPDIRDINKTFLKVLSANGLSSDEMSYNKKVEWRRFHAKGESYFYEFTPSYYVDTAPLKAEITEGIWKLRAVNARDIRINRTREGKTEIIEVLYKGSRAVYARIIVTAKASPRHEKKPEPRGEEKATPVSPEEKVIPLPTIQEKGRGRLAVVLDDFGYNTTNLGVLSELGFPVTFAVLPDLPATVEACKRAAANGDEVILHMPMEPLSYSAALEKGTIMAGMESSKVRSLLAGALSSVYNAKGVSNHQGSKATSDKHVMKSVMVFLKEKGLFFLDSFTASGSVCPEIARQTGISFTQRDVFVDNEMDRASIMGKFREAADIAMRKGSAVAIGHDRSLTVRTLKEIGPELKAKGVKFVRLSELVR
ncbi:MAG: divergent polysaccharide deacetylase family protein [Candidatus Omnitrophica bacterium]|nr:divergent polysaccharide deacetylase family protein [Candidatus Omnitrophota bacterium]